MGSSNTQYKMNKLTFTCPATYNLGLNSSSTMNNCVDLLNGAILNSYTTQKEKSIPISTFITRNLICITSGPKKLKLPNLLQLVDVTSNFHNSTCYWVYITTKYRNFGR